MNSNKFGLEKPSRIFRQGFAEIQMEGEKRKGKKEREREKGEIEGENK